METDRLFDRWESKFFELFSDEKTDCNTAGTTLTVGPKRFAGKQEPIDDQRDGAARLVQAIDFIVGKRMMFGSQEWFTSYPYCY